MSYSDLLTDVPALTARGDLTSQIPGFIRLAEDKINRNVRVAEMRQRVEASSLGLNPLQFDTRGRFLEPITIRSLTADGSTQQQFRMVSDRQLREMVELKNRERVFAVGNLPGNTLVTEFDGTNQLNAPRGFLSDKFVTTQAGSNENDAFTMCASFTPANAGVTTQAVSFGGAGIGASVSNAMTFSGTATSTGQFSFVVPNVTIAANTRYSVVANYDFSTGDAAAVVNGVVSEPTGTIINGTENLVWSDVAVGRLGFIGTVHAIGLVIGQQIDVLSVYKRAFAQDSSFIGTSGRRVFGVKPDVWVPDGGVGSFPLLSGITAATEPARDDKTAIVLNPAPVDGEDFEMMYYEALPALSSTNDSHWLIDKHYDLYLYGALAEAYDYLQNPSQEENYRSKMAGVIDAINGQNQQKLRGNGPYIRRHGRRITP